MKCCLLFRFNLFYPILLNRYLHLSDPPPNVVKYYHYYTCGRHDSICGTRRQWPRSMGLTLIITISRPLSRGDLSQSARRPRSRAANESSAKFSCEIATWDANAKIIRDRRRNIGLHGKNMWSIKGSTFVAIIIVH